MIFEALHFELFRFKFYSLSSKILKIPEFNLYIKLNSFIPAFEWKIKQWVSLFLRGAYFWLFLSDALYGIFYNNKLYQYKMVHPILRSKALLGNPRNKINHLVDLRTARPVRWIPDLTSHLKQFLQKTELFILIWVTSIWPFSGMIWFPHLSQFAAFNRW